MRFLILFLFLSSCVTPRPTPRPDPLPPSLPKPIPTNYCASNADFRQAAGKYRVGTRTVGRIKVTYPMGTNGCKMVPTTFCNGTGGNLWMFRAHARKLASHGFYVSSYETTQSGSGRQAMEALDYAMRQKDVSKTMAFVLGMSQGGQCVVSTQYKLEQKYMGIRAPGVPMVPAFGMSNPRWQLELPKIKSPIFMYNGSMDAVVSKPWVMSGWNLVRSSPSYFYTAVGANHINSVKWAEDAALPFALYTLFGRQDAKAYFEGLPTSRWWSFVAKK